MSRRTLAATGLLLAGLALVACAPSAVPPGTTPSGTATRAATDAADRAPSPTWTPSGFDAALSAELIEMLAQDQADRLAGDGDGTDEERTERLREIIVAHGWPTYSLVGEEAEDAAWAIAQHSDHDPDFQREAREWLRIAVENDDASPGNLAYLTDRIAVGAGEPQTYGTQIGCGEDGPTPSTPIADEAAVDERRAEAGLAPLADYYAELEAVCAAE
ncbi:DUF6624 domain-containing protein [Microbacterium sp. B35-30]|uniref:DUF6624 domain-containing protein n=1 Tax=Microbacterium sp. B35-30 TaxID=1962642 RepID=UPI0013D1C210|nr:DUF6624 domain-containing protein [Microbacterium sp. B35-30]